MNKNDLLKELSKFSLRKDNSGRYKMGRAIKDSDLPYLEILNSMGYINIGIDYKTRESTISITKKGNNLILII